MQAAPMQAAPMQVAPILDRAWRSPVNKKCLWLTCKWSKLNNT